MARRNLVTAKSEQEIVAHARQFDPISCVFERQKRSSASRDGTIS
jgi:hypothetical protein